MNDDANIANPPQTSAEARELGEKSIKAIADLTRQNMELMLTVAQVATQSFRSVVSDVTDFSRQSVERASTAAHAMTLVTSPGELLRMQAEFANAQFEAARAEISKYSDAMFRSTREQLAIHERHSSSDAPMREAPASSRKK